MGIVAFALVLAPLVGGEPAPSSAPAAGVVVIWDAPPSCPSQADVAAAVTRRVGARAVEVRAGVVEAEGRFDAALEVRSETGTTTRTLQSPACATLVDAVVLLAVVATDPVPTLESIAPRLQDAAPMPEPSPTTPPLSEPLPMISEAPPSETAPPVDEAKRSPWREVLPRVAAFGILGGGTLPGIDAGIRGAIGIATPRVHVDATALYLGPRVTERDDVRVRIDAWAVGVRVCPVIPLPTKRVELPICAVVGAGQLRGRADGQRLIEQRPQQGPWVTLAAAPELAIVVHRLVRIVVGAEVGGTLLGQGFGVRGLGSIWTPKRWLARAQLGIEVRFR